MVEVALKVSNAISRAGEKVGRAFVRRPAPWQMRIESGDVQGLVFRGYGSLTQCCYLLLQVRDPAKARSWLKELVTRIAPGDPPPRNTAIQIAFTHGGLAKLGLPEPALQGFSREFVGGMTDPNRSRFLGDEGDSAPDRWQWGGTKNDAVHAVLMLYADTAERLKQLYDELRKGFSARGIDEIKKLEASELQGKEHFGFADGISQPAIEGYHRSSSNLHLIKPGEFLLGYPNEYGLYTGRPMVAAAQDPLARLPLDVERTPRHDFGRNGTYLVFRQLRQDVPGFRAMLDSLTRNPDGSSNRPARERLAAQMVGRWPSGASLVEAPDGDDFTKAKSNEFRYHEEDEYGLKCPIGAHVRRSNPRDALLPDPGTENSMRINRRHRLIRRGRTYGPPLAEGAVDKTERGLFFICVNANIIRQFEFVQHSWLNDPRFNGLYNEADPIAGSLTNHEFAVPGPSASKRYSGLSRFVSVVGGAYFFMPGVRALRYLSEVST